MSKIDIERKLVQADFSLDDLEEGSLDYVAEQILTLKGAGWTRLVMWSDYDYGIQYALERDATDKEVQDEITNREARKAAKELAYKQELERQDRARYEVLKKRFEPQG